MRTIDLDDYEVEDFDMLFHRLYRREAPCEPSTFDLLPHVWILANRRIAPRLQNDVTDAMRTYSIFALQHKTSTPTRYSSFHG